ncbi:hypothetical protein RF11_03489 [Thelohanellus kitauei]|uniref:Uncharacterized protein n=1 Tax=Thelohanellus kitauei TaxID=669202 RepID=A0A0C2J4A1_THEKT|nr:hypothetical protein RF11_03489 [Thelohanellus kitauei]
MILDREKSGVSQETVRPIVQNKAEDPDVTTEALNQTDLKNNTSQTPTSQPVAVESTTGTPFTTEKAETDEPEMSIEITIPLAPEPDYIVATDETFVIDETYPDEYDTYGGGESKGSSKGRKAEGKGKTSSSMIFEHIIYLSNKY